MEKQTIHRVALALENSFSQEFLTCDFLLHMFLQCLQWACFRQELEFCDIHLHATMLGNRDKCNKMDAIP
uniref:Uncharacterized protein n=1 Tax=Anguilla anguilla TaxID=7936 RepID=A0A0E9X9P4_ANGAN